MYSHVIIGIMAVTDIVCEWPGPVFYHLMTVVRVQPLAWSVENVPSYQLLSPPPH